MFLPAPVRAAEPPDEALNFRQISPDQRRRLLRGDVIGYAMSETGDRQLAAGLAVYAIAPMSRLADALASGEPIIQDPANAAHGVVPEVAGPAAFTGVRLAPDEIGEAQALLEATPGTHFNLSRREIDGFRELKTKLASAGKTAVVDTVSAQYRLMLFQRWQSYQTAGLGGIAPYARRAETVSDPGADLRAAAGDAGALAHVLPGLSEALLRYPAVAGARPTTSQGYWMKRPLQGRPAMLLAHYLVAARPDLAVLVERHIFVSHSYNWSQTILGGISYQDGILLFSINRTATEHVAGLGNELKRSVARRQLRAEAQRRLDRLRASLIRPARPESP